MINFGLGVHLETLNTEDLVLALDWRNDPKIWRWTRQSDLLSETHHYAWAKSIESNPTIKMFAVSLDVTTIGVCGLTSINTLNRNAEFSLYIAPEYHGKGFGKKALMTLFYHGFKNMNLKSIWGETLFDNRAQEMFKKIGMIEDGRRRQFYFKDGHYCNAILFSIMDHEFLIKHGEKSCF